MRPRSWLLRAAATLAGAALLAGCHGGAPPVAPAAELVLGDERPVTTGEPPPLGLSLFVPLVPFESSSSDEAALRSFLPEVKAALRASGRFGTVVGPGDPGPARRAAPWTVEVTILEACRTHVVTSYGLGIFGLVLHALGAPLEYTAITIRARVGCGPRGAARRARERDETELTLRWLYEDEVAPEEEEALAAAVRAVVVDGVEASLARGE